MVSYSGDGVIKLWDLSLRSLIQEIRTEYQYYAESIASIAISNDNKTIAFGNLKGVFITKINSQI
jgi:WD40 repeat protein